MKIPTKVDLNNVDNSSNLEEANQVRYIPTIKKIKSQKRYKIEMGRINAGSVIN